MVSTVSSSYYWGNRYAYGIGNSAASGLDSNYTISSTSNAKQTNNVQSSSQGDVVAVYQKNSSASSNNTNTIYSHPMLKIFGGNVSFLNGFYDRILEDFSSWVEKENQDGNFLDHIKNDINQFGDFVDDKDMIEIGQGMDQFFAGLQDSTQKQLDKELEKKKPKDIEELQNRLNTIIDLRSNIQSSIQEIRDRLNPPTDPDTGGGGTTPTDPGTGTGGGGGTTPTDPGTGTGGGGGTTPTDPGTGTGGGGGTTPTDPGNGNTTPPVNPYQPPVITNNSTAYNQDRVIIDIGSGSNKSSIIIQNAITANRSDTLFYVTDASGRRSAVSLDFGNTTLEREFMKRFKKSKMYGETVSLEKLNRFMDRVKEYVDSLKNINVDRLLAKVNGGKDESNRFDAIISQFDKLLLTLK